MSNHSGCSFGTFSASLVQTIARRFYKIANKSKHPCKKDEPRDVLHWLTAFKHTSQQHILSVKIMRYSSKHERIILNKFRKSAHNLYLVVVTFPKMINADRIVILINNFTEPLLYFFKLCAVDKHFKNRVLNANAIIAAYGCHFSEPCCSVFMSEIHIICYKYHHIAISTKTADIRQGRRAYILPAALPDKKESVLSVFFLSEMGE